MSASETIQARIQLRSVEDLFSEPEADPFDPAPRYVSGIDEIASPAALAEAG